MVNLVDQIRRGFPDSGYNVNPAIREFHKFRQGVLGMTTRAEQSVFWPSITRDVVETRAKCTKCHRIASSQPAAPPVSPPSPA